MHLGVNVQPVIIIIIIIITTRGGMWAWYFK